MGSRPIQTAIVFRKGISMVFFLIYLGRALQCIEGICVPVPYEAIAYMIQFGFLELTAEVGGILFYVVKKRK